MINFIATITKRIQCILKTPDDYYYKKIDKNNFKYGKLSHKKVINNNKKLYFEGKL